MAPCDLSPPEGEQRDLMATLKNETPESERLNPEAPEFVPFGVAIPPPAEPVAPAALVESAATVESTEPEQSAEPEKATEPAKPEKPADPVVPAESTEAAPAADAVDAAVLGKVPGELFLHQRNTFPYSIHKHIRSLLFLCNSVHLSHVVNVP